jgi:hypothetical protein
MEEKRIQYVIHCVASPSKFFPPSKALNDMYAGYTNPARSTINLIPPAERMTMKSTRKVAAKK